MTTTVRETSHTHPKRKSRPESVLIVGAGPGGLAAALLLKQAGLQVKIIERMPRVGGRCSAIEEQGFRFDLGPTFFLYPRVLESIFRVIGRNLHDEIPMVRLDPQYRVHFGTTGGQLDCTPDLKRMAAEVAKLNPADGANVERFIADNRVKLESFRPVLESPFLGWKDLLSWELIKMIPLLRPWASVDGELRRYFQDPRTRLAFSFQSKYLGMSPFNCPSLFSILSYLEYDFGVWHPYGGCSSVSEGMARIAEELGVEIELNESVEEILFEGRRAVGVRTESGEHRADALILNSDFANTMTKLVPNHLRRRWTDEKLAKKKYSCSTFMLYLGIDGVYDHLPHHSIYTSENYLGNLDDIEKHHRLTDDASIYIQNATPTDPSLAPPGMSTIYCLVPVTHQHGNVNWAEQKQKYRDTVIRQMAKLGMGDIEKRIRYEKILTPANWEFDHEVYKGATFNLAHNLGQMLHLRPRNRFEDLDGVYLVGGGTHPGSGLPVIYESARITSRLLLQDFGRDVAWLDAEGAVEASRPLSRVGCSEQ